MMARDAVVTAPQCLVARAMGTRHNNPKESCVRIYQGKRKKQQSKWFFFPTQERAPFLRATKKDDGVRRCGEGASSVPQHLNMKRMLNQKSMWEWMRTKSGEKYGDVFRVLYMLSLSQTIKEEFLPTHLIPTKIPKAQQI